MKSPPIMAPEELVNIALEADIQPPQVRQEIVGIFLSNCFKFTRTEEVISYMGWYQEQHDALAA